MIAVDTNLLVYSHRRDAPFHAAAKEIVRALAEGSEAWALPWPCVHEFLANVTNPRIYRTPTVLGLALEQVDQWLTSPRASLLCESDGYWKVLVDLLRDSDVVGAKIHDARIAALCLNHGVSELWTADRDFARFRGLNARNPLRSS